MKKKATFIGLFFAIVFISKAQDSIAPQFIGDTVEAHASFNKVGKMHRVFYGENYRKEWAAATKLPIIKISEIEGGLTPESRGGGQQTHSLRLIDRNGIEWVLRSVEKFPEAILPANLRQTFVKDIVTDAMSAQHPYSALIVPPIANAVNVPHTNPIIGIVAPDKALGIYSDMFINTVCLLENREPLGKSDNYLKMQSELARDNDNTLDSSMFLRARLLDIFIGDWDRHGDQWRFLAEKNGKGKRYIPIPRDRDQVFYINQGIFPSIESKPWIAPFTEGFNPRIRNSATFFFSSTDLNQRLLNQFSFEEWMRITNQFTAAITDSVLETALQRLPKSSYDLRHDVLLNTLKSRRNDLPRAMAAYYRFLNKIVDIQLTDANELVEIKDAPDNSMQVIIHKMNKNGVVKEQLFSKVFNDSITKEIRIFMRKGNDSMLVNSANSTIKLRIVGGDGNKHYDIIDSKKKVAVYDHTNAVFSGRTGKVSKRLSNDSLNTAVKASNLFNIAMPLVDAGYNIDDGIILGVGIKYTHQGFRKSPYASVQQFTIAHSFSTKAFNMKYKGEWLHALGKADLTLQVNAFAPDNTQNFFGTGNETSFIKTGDFKRYYRARFSLYNAEPAIRWENKKGTSFSVGPSVQYYRFDSEDNIGRLITNHSFIHTYDSGTVAQSKLNAGVAINFISDKRDNLLVPTAGSYIKLKVSGYLGANSYAKSYSQITSEIRVYKSLNKSKSIVIADKIGGGITLGNAAFYQSYFLGGEENLAGYRQYRFAGQHELYNNFEVRIRLAHFASYVMPGSLGLIGFYDVGRVWEKNDQSNKWHNGTGGGFYFSPADLIVFHLVAGYSTEGWYPVFTVGMRF